MLTVDRTRTSSRTRFSVRLLTALTGAALAWTATGRGSAPAVRAQDDFERVAAAVQQKMGEYGVPGVALGISHRGQRLTRSFGVTSVENPLPITEATLFQAGSITKTVTATVAMRLVEAGKLSLDAPVREYLPTFAVADADASRHATLRTLLTHMGGWEGDLRDLRPVQAFPLASSRRPEIATSSSGMSRPTRASSTGSRARAEGASPLSPWGCSEEG